MTWRTHLVIGANTAWLTALVGQVDGSILFLLPTAAFASLLPDIDAVTAKVHYIGGGVLGIFRGGFTGTYFHHRGLMHSIFVALVLSFVVGLFTARLIPLLSIIFFLAYLSHPIIDGFNTTVGYLYPFWMVRFALVPKALRSPVDGLVDNVLFIFGIISLLIFFWLFHSQFFPASLLN